MKKIYNITQIGITHLIVMIVVATTMNLQAQTCSQVEILYQSPVCLDKRQGSAGLGGNQCVETAVCVNQPSTYSSSVTGAGWTFNWTATGPSAVVINPNNTSAVVNIVWPQVGVFTLTLTATDGSGNVFTYCLKINVKERPIAGFTFAPNNVCVGNSISFTNTTTFSGGGAAYSWDFGDPASGANNYSTLTNPFHTFNSVGVYTVTLVAFSFANSGAGTSPDDPQTIVSCCADTFAMQVTIIPGSLTIECISTVCAGDTATYTSVGCANPIWLPPVGGVFLSPPSGNTVAIIWGNGNPQGQIVAQCPGGCIATVTVPIIPANPIILGNANPCFNSNTSYSLPLLPGTFYTWTLTNISTATNYNNLLNTHPDNNTVWIDWSLAPPGTYLLGINLTNNHICCNSNGSLFINPTLAWQAFSDQTVCTGTSGASLFALPGAGTYNWTVLPPNAGVSPLTGTGSSFNPTFSNTGNYTIQVTETGNNYCNSGITNPQQIQVTVVGTPAPGTINGPSTICAGSTYDYNMSSNAPTGYHYAWSITAGTGSFEPGPLPTATGNNTSILWSVLPGTISVVLQRNGTPACPRPPVTLNVTQATVGSISGPLNVCVDGTGTYTLSGGNLPPGEIITWSLAAPFSSMGTIISGQGTNSIIVLWHGQPGVGPWGPVTINASTGCGNATPLPGIMIFPKFSFTITKTGTDICQPGGVTLTATGAPGGATYLWSPGGQTTSSITNINIANTYSVTVTKGGCSSTQQYLVDDPFSITPVTCGVGTCSATNSTNQLLGVTILKPLVGTFTYQWYSGIFPSGTLISGATTPNYTTPTHGDFYVVVTYGACSKHLSFQVSKVCCPDVNNPQITSIVRNTCNSYTFTGTTPNPFGAPITWYWGDGTSDSATSGVPITHVYTLAGVYCVTFCVGPPSPNTTNCSGNCVATNVTVPIDAAFSYTLGCNGCLNVSNSSTVITTNPSFVTYLWNLGDGNTSTAQSPGTHCYALPGTYVVTLTVTYNDGVVTCTKTATHTVIYTILGINISPIPVCTGTAATFSSTPGSFVSYTWDFGDGFTAYTASTTHIYNAPGTYVVNLTVIDQLGNTCNASSNVNVLPGIGPCSIQGAFICPGGVAVLSTPNFAGFTYLWEEEISPNVFAPAPGANTNNSYAATAPGFYRVNITGVNGCTCTTKKVEVKAVPKPIAIIAVAPSAAICGSGNITLTSVNHLNGYTSDWYANGNYGNLLSSGQVHFEFGLAITTIFNLVLTNEYGCSDTCSFTVIVNPIPTPPVITSSPTLCEGVPITLTVTNYSNGITWNTGAAGTSITVTSAGSYVATYTDSATGCSSNSSIVINRRPPVALFPHYCDSIPCTCRNPQGDFTIYAPLPLIGNFAAVYNIQWYFNNVPVGTNGPNPFFTPAVTGTYHIVVTDPITGCTDTSETYSVVVPVCNACDSTTCHVDLGNDTTICAGNVVTITSQSCAGTAILYELGPNGPIPLGPGPIWDVFPTQNTCYVVECCDSLPDEINNGYYLCCCTDTICINVNPLPVVTWPTVYPSVCLNSAPVYLDSLLINVSPTGGTGVFSGVNVIGNYFYPNALGPHAITYCYTDTNGCTACVSDTINVIFCCDSTTCHVDAGNDTTICVGGVAILHATGCDTIPIWYVLTANGPVQIGQGEVIDVSPQQTTCYVVFCCTFELPANVGGAIISCCCSDTICVFVNPLPVVSWPTVYPTVCLNSSPVYLDSLLINVSPTGGTGVFSGVNVTGNYFNPIALGSQTITYCYTDLNGCTTCVSNTINVIFCCDSTSCHVDAGNDTTICAGGVVILTAQGCSGSAQWYKLGANGPVPIGQGGIVDVFPQQTTCYMVICCCPVGPVLCCDTDTVCVFVNPLPIVTWPTVYPTVCLNSSPVYLDSLLINVSPTGGTGVFSGVNVTGNYFNPIALGSQTITYCYTDLNGCTMCVSNTINVIFCCDSTVCHVDGGNDTTICAGGVVILSAQGCSGTPQWYKLGVEGPEPIGQGGIVDVFPQQTTCYMVICCCPVGPILCCDTDTVCITVKPVPHLSWPLSYANVCLNSNSIYLDANNVFVTVNNTQVPITSTGGTWTWSGTGVVGNFFYPNTLGSHVVTLCYTAPNGCTACITNTITVISCCENSCQVNAGEDQTICAGGVAILQSTGCDSTTTWYILTPEGPLPIWQGNVVDVTPQQSTCYIAICCCPETMCCDTDTVCITVKPLPQLYWAISYADVCLNSAPVFLDANNVFVTINNTQVPITSTGGTWTWSGTGMTGNFFNPTTLGPHVITLCYTDPNGCIACVTNTINVINCCNGTGCEINAGPDLTICAGQPVTIAVEGCNSMPLWYALSNEGGEPVLVDQGEILYTIPTQSTCYIVVCCNPQPCCCDTDTVCVTVRPLPVLQWPVQFLPVCLNSAPIYLDSAGIYVYIGNTWVSLASAGGSGTFYGSGVIGNYFYPTTLGAHFITYVYTDPFGCVESVTINIVVKKCKVKIHLDVLIEGLYIGGGTMIAVVDPDNNPNVCDTITVDLHSATAPHDLVYSVTGTIDVHGHGVFEFPEDAQDNTYYIAVRHRNALETWSKNAILLSNEDVIFNFIVK